MSLTRLCECMQHESSRGGQLPSSQEIAPLPKLNLGDVRARYPETASGSHGAERQLRG